MNDPIQLLPATFRYYSSTPATPLPAFTVPARALAKVIAGMLFMDPEADITLADSSGRSWAPLLNRINEGGIYEWYWLNATDNAVEVPAGVVTVNYPGTQLYNPRVGYRVIALPGAGATPRTSARIPATNTYEAAGATLAKGAPAAQAGDRVVLIGRNSETALTPIAGTALLGDGRDVGNGWALPVLYRTADEAAAGSPAVGSDTPVTTGAYLALAWQPAAQPNTPPIANAGPDQTVDAFATVTVAATATDPDGSIASLTWSQVSGPNVSLAGAGASRTFDAPGVLGGTTVVLRATATDNQGATHTDDVTVTVREPSTFELTATGWAGLRVTTQEYLARIARDASNTGWQPTGVTLNALTGALTINQPGTYDLLNVQGRLTIAASDVTVRRFRVNANGDPYGVYVLTGCQNVQLQDGEIFGASTRAVDGAGTARYTLTRVNVHTSVDFVQLRDFCYLHDSFCHDNGSGVDGVDHYDGVGADGFVGWQVLGSTIVMTKSAAAGGTAALWMGDSRFAPSAGLAQYNRFASGAHYVIWSGTGNPDYGGLQLLDNQLLGASPSDYDGIVGLTGKPALPLTGFVAGWVAANNTAARNRRVDGTLLAVA